MNIWTIIPVDPTEAMSSYSAILFVAVAIVCIFLYKQNMKLKEELEGKEKELKEHTNKEAGILHSRIEKVLKSYSDDLKDVGSSTKEAMGAMSRVEKTVIGLTSDVKYLTKTVDEMKCQLRDKK